MKNPPMRPISRLARTILLAKSISTTVASAVLVLTTVAVAQTHSFVTPGGSGGDEPPLFSGLGPFNPSDARVTAPFMVSGTTVFQTVQTTDPLMGGDLEFRFNAPATGYYAVFVSLYCPDEGANSLYINLDAQPTNPTMIWDVPISTGWESRKARWRGAATGASPPEFDPKVWLLTQGEHLFVIRGREANAVIGPITIILGRPVTYDYVGSTYTFTDAPPGTPGLTLDDYITVRQTLDSAFWGGEGDGPGIIRSGPYRDAAYLGRVTMDLTGNILAWYLSGSGAGFDLFSHSNLDGSGQDKIWYSRDTFAMAYRDYQAGSRNPASSWVRISYPGVVVSQRSGDFVVQFAGVLQQSLDLTSWTDVPEPPSSPLIIPRADAPPKLFFRTYLNQSSSTLVQSLDPLPIGNRERRPRSQNKDENENEKFP